MRRSWGFRSSGGPSCVALRHGGDHRCRSRATQSEEVHQSCFEPAEDTTLEHPFPFNLKQVEAIGSLPCRWMFGRAQVRAQRVGPVHVTPDQHDDGARFLPSEGCVGPCRILCGSLEDLTMIPVPTSCVGFVTGSQGNFLRTRMSSPTRSAY